MIDLRLGKGAALGLMAVFGTLAACDDVKAPAPAAKAPAMPAAAFSHQISGDLSGYYTPAAPISIDGYRVKALSSDRVRTSPPGRAEPSPATSHRS